MVTKLDCEVDVEGTVDMMDSRQRDPKASSRLEQAPNKRHPRPGLATVSKVPVCTHGAVRRYARSVS